jgi:hypothetical protein
MHSLTSPIVFHPPRTLGLAIHGFIISLLVLLGVWGLWQAANADIGPVFLLYLLPALLGVVLVPILTYRAYALYGAYYVLERGGIRLRWGLRIEHIPMDVVEWIHPANDLEPAVPLPFFRLPGGVLGTRKLPAGGEVEFMASTSRDLLVIATPSRAYAVSPADRESYLAAYQSLAELGTITPLATRSVHPTFLVNRVWTSRLARSLLLIGFIAGFALLALVVLSIPTRSQVFLGFRPTGEPGDPIPAVRLMLLPVLSWSFYLINLFTGFFFYRNEESHYLAYMVWVIGALMPLLFLVGVIFILQSG